MKWRAIHGNAVLQQLSPCSRPAASLFHPMPTFARTMRLNQLKSDEDFEQLLDDMIYSGDIEGYLQRKSHELVSEGFVSFLQEKVHRLTEEDEKEVVREIVKILEEKLRLTDGLEDSDLVFERRLDQIIFTAPRFRRAYIQEHIEEMTPGFVDYVQNELQGMTDTDSKVVLASILLMIGQVKNEDYLGSQASLISLADATLGEEFANATPANKKTPLGDRNEQILAGLLFSKRDLVDDILNNLHVLDDEFMDFLEKKISSVQTDLEERQALSSLLQTIRSVQEKIEEVEASQGDAIEEEATFEEIKQRMRDIQAGGGVQDQDKDKDKRVESFIVKEDKRQTFQAVLQRFQTAFGSSEGNEQQLLREAVVANYDLCDYEFLKTLREEVAACHEEGANVEAAQYEQLLQIINEVMVDHMGSAQTRLKRILSKRDPKIMQAEATAMARRGEVDEALILLIQANIQQAQIAQATPAVQVLSKILQAILVEKERQLPEEQKLLRKLLKVDKSEERKGLLFDAFKPSKVPTMEGEWVEKPPLITPPVFINMVRSFIENFGNVDSMDIMGRAKVIIDEAQVVATDLYGEGMTPREQQKFMFEKNTISVWDLAKLEEEALMSGQEVPWRNDAYDDKEPEEVLGERVKRVGGQEE
eukprot:gene11712-13148_t